MRSVSLLVLAMMIAGPAAAQVYEWRDAQGQLQYSDLPPLGVDAKVVYPTLKPVGVDDKAGAAPAAAKPKTLAEKELEFRQRRAEAAEAQAKAEQDSSQAVERQRACEQARNQLGALRSGQRIARFNSKGEREYLDDAGRADEIERTQKFADSVCK